jgi:two-component system phosphate regulon response regulator OmpR
MKHNILIIDDDISLNQLLEEFLSGFGFKIDYKTNPIDGIETVKQNRDKFDAVILDVMMPELDGFTTLKKIREISNIPVIMLTARGDVTDRIVGLEIGADDYMPKPFEPRELVARLKAILKRSEVNTINTENIKTNTGLTLFPLKKEATLNENHLNLTTMEYDLLELLVKKRGKILDRDFIMESLKGYEWAAFDRSIDVAISRLRNKLNDNPSNPKFIKTVRGAGYIFVG